ncbi:MAG: nucleotidyltransferase domain-containing protein, partial [Pseudomonadota bacterium]|nr:nucleotidyltransferase domain-containing protein [Pseudomonadota bacterium]
MLNLPKAPDKLICPAGDIFDAQAVGAEIAEAAQTAPDAALLRSAVVPILLKARKAGMAAIAEAFAADPFKARPTTRAYTWLTDCLVVTAKHVATQHMHPNPDAGEEDRLSLLAVGGYGRGEMAPQSDVDLLFLTPKQITPWAEKVIESMLYILWDLRLKVGHASRTVRDCLKLGREDFTIRTALMEHRYLTGDAELPTELAKRLTSELFKGSAAEFIEAKLEERDARHERQGGQRYVVEPNVKEGKGCLRDLQSLFWIAKYVHNVRNVKELVKL